MTRPRILLDVDDVIGDFKGYYVKTANKLSGEYYSVEQITGWNIDEILNFPSWLSREVSYHISRADEAHNIAVVPGAKEFVRELEGIADVVFVTSPLKTSRTWAHDRTEWLVGHFG